MSELEKQKGINKLQSINGLPNLGATCYMNSALQIISQIFSDYFISGKYHEDLNFDVKKQTQLEFSKKIDFIADFTTLLQLMNQNKKGKIVSYKLRIYLLKIINYLSTLENFKEYGRKQADSSGFLINLLDLLSQYTKHSYTINVKLNCPENKLNSFDRKKLKFADYLKNSTEKISYIDEKLTGFYKYTSKCSHEDCKYISEKIEPFTFLLLDIDSKGNTLENSIRKYIKPEKLNENNKITCEKCKRKSQSTRKISFWKFSDFILIGFKRFNQTYIVNRGVKISKNNSKIKFPVDNLDVSEFVEDEESNMIYELSAAVIHVGGCNNGHYFVIRRINNSDQWFLIDDNKVIHLMNGFDISGAYYLLYKKVN